MVPSSKQLFLTSQSPLPLCKISLVAILDLAEQLGVSEAFVCITRETAETAEMTSEFTSMGFKILSPRSQPMAKFVVLRFDF
jgi:N-acetylglutamate synthase-like GNAT family acetyltransferase